MITDDIKTNGFDEKANLIQLRLNIDLRIESHIISATDYKNDEILFVVRFYNGEHSKLYPEEVKNTQVNTKVKKTILKFGSSNIYLN